MQLIINQMSRNQNNQKKNNPNSKKFQTPISTYKWSQKQDDKLREAVLKYGTQWTTISKKYRFDRTINSLIKRWHGKLKDQNLNSDLSQEPSANNDSQIHQVAAKSKRFKKQDDSQMHQVAAKSKKFKKQENNLQIHQVAAKSKKFKKQEKKAQKNQQKHQQSKQDKIEFRGDIKQNIRRKKQENKIQVKQEDRKNRTKKSQQLYEQVDVNLSQIESVSSDESYVFKHHWSQHQDAELKKSVLFLHILDWHDLSTKLKISDLKEIKKRWEIKIYPSIVDSIKIGGCVKYSEEEDSILSYGVKLGLSVSELRRFLPGRTAYSLDARRRRTLKMQEMQYPETRFWVKRLNIKNFVIKRHEQIQKPGEQESFMYGSDSQ